MDAQRHNRLSMLFAAACRLASDERERFLSSECGGDTDLLEEVLRLLDCDAEPEPFLDTPIMGDDFRITFADEVSDESRFIGRRISSYVVTGVIASGGMGTVFEARQREPNRLVALKIMRPGLISQSARRRFEYEAQVLGRLRHAHIAQVYEAGHYDDGSGPAPFFAMEHVADAMPITRYASERRLELRERLTLFVKVCEAVHYGHLKGIIHRDLKPANILVDAHGEMKVIDFGVARAIDSDLALTTVRTDVGQLVGTLQYMSPEQCSTDPGDSAALDTRSDVYSLGVVLFELACGSVPYDVSGLSLAQATRDVRERPPARLSECDRSLRGDLETIVLKALEKDAARRYVSAHDLAEDVRRYLNDEPISARPPSALYRFRKFARRNRVAVAIAAIALAALLIGLGGVSYGLLRAEAERRVAQDRAASLAAVIAFYDHLLDSASPNVARGREMTVREALERAAERVEVAPPAEPLVEATVRHTIGANHRMLGLMEPALRHLERAYELRMAHLGEGHLDTLETANEIAVVMESVGRLDDAEHVHRRTHALRLQSLGETHEKTLDSLNNLGYCLGQLRRFDEAEQLLRRAVALRREHQGPDEPATLTAINNLALVLTEMGRLHDAEPLYRESLEGRRRISGDDHPYTLGALGNYAWHLLDLAQYAEAEPLFREAMERGARVQPENQSRLLALRNGLARALQQQRKYAEAEPVFQGIVDETRALYGDDDPRTAGAINALGVCIQRSGEIERAEPLLRETLDIAFRVFGEMHVNTAVAMHNYAKQLSLQGRNDDAAELFARCSLIDREVFGPKHPKTIVTLHAYGIVLLDLERNDEAQAILDPLSDVASRVLGDEHEETLELASRVGALREKRDQRDPE